MDKQAYAHRRKKRYMAQILTAFEEMCQAHVPREAAEDFKGTVRRKMHALTIDICEVIALNPGEELNGEAVALRDRIFADTPPSATNRSDNA